MRTFCSKGAIWTRKPTKCTGVFPYSIHSYQLWGNMVPGNILIKIFKFTISQLKYQEIFSVLSTFPRPKSTVLHSKTNPCGKTLAKCYNSEKSASDYSRRNQTTWKRTGKGPAALLSHQYQGQTLDTEDGQPAWLTSPPATSSSPTSLHPPWTFPSLLLASPSPRHEHLKWQSPLILLSFATLIN